MKQIKLTGKPFNKGVAAGGGYQYEIIDHDGRVYILDGWHMSAPSRIIFPDGKEIDLISEVEDRILDATSESLLIPQIIEEEGAKRPCHSKNIDVDGNYVDINSSSFIEDEWKEVKHGQTYCPGVGFGHYTMWQKVATLDMGKANELFHKVAELINKKFGVEVYVDEEMSEYYNRSINLKYRGEWLTCFASQTYSLNTPRYWDLSPRVQEMTPEEYLEEYLGGIEEKIKKIDAEKKAAEEAAKEVRKEKFTKLSTMVVERFGKDVLKVVKRHKGTILRDMETLMDYQDSISTETALKAVKVASGVVLQNLLELVNANPSEKKVKKVLKKAYAWKYLKDSLPDVTFYGYFDEAMEAMRVYVENNFYDESDYRLVWSC